MKNTHICPKCKSKNVLKVPDAIGYNTIAVKGFLSSTILITRYVCCECGFMEEWIEEKNDLKKLKRNIVNFLYGC